nr:methyltransferase domain-containing protein [uncultured Brevundimonas sp.]
MFRRLFQRDSSVAPLRDTDADWDRIARSDPYYGVLTDPRFRTENLTKEALAEFFKSGEGAVKQAAKRLKSRHADFAPASALDFGCGVGRLTRALAAMTGDAYGVDVAEAMLAEARQHAPTSAAFGRELPERAFDWIVSLIVFQHIPPERGYRLLEALLQRLAPGGFVTLQFALYRDPVHAGAPGGRIVVDGGTARAVNAPVLHDLPKGEMVMFDYDLTVIVAILAAGGVTDLDLVHTNHGGFHGAFLYGRRAAS